MDARAHPRITVRLKIELVCPDQNNSDHRLTTNVSLGGIYVAGSPCGNIGTPLAVVITPIHRPQECSAPFPSTVVRSTPGGFALRFDSMSQQQADELQCMIRPRWDGENIFEGLLIAASQENVTELSDCLRLSSVVCDRFRRQCSISKWCH